MVNLVNVVKAVLGVQFSEYDEEFTRVVLASSRVKANDKAYTICLHFGQLDKQSVIKDLIKGYYV